MSHSDLIADIEVLASRYKETVDAIPTGVDSLVALCKRKTTTFETTLYQPVFCLVLQGQKETWLGERCVRFGAGESLIVSHHLPVVSRVVEASAKKPYIALAMPVDLSIIRSLYDELDETDLNEVRAHSIEAGQTDVELVQAIARLFGLTDRPVEAKVMAPLILREIHFRLLLARHGAMLRQLLRHESTASRIAKAINRIHQDFRMALSVPELAQTAGMSASTFHEHFKSVTATSPLQYQKDLRLIEARRLLSDGHQSVSSIAFEVGYESPSQFSREYARRFGASPRNDLTAAE
ncbi:MAG: AraC family transcriptional regulator [Stappiaceae bacterium]